MKPIRTRLFMSILIVIVFLQPALSQVQIFDSGYLKAKYSFRYRPDSTNATHVNEDILVLEVGKNFSKYYSYYKMIADSIIAANSNSVTGVNIQNATAALNNISAGSTKTMIRNLTTNVYTISHILGAVNYRYADTTGPLKWVITSDTATVHGFLCIKANVQFRGRNYEAWFTGQVPVSVGPSFFYGLPGIIVRVEELRGNFVFNLVSLEVLNNKTPMYLDNKKALIVSRKEYRKAIALMYDDMDAFALSQGMVMKTKSINGVSNPPPIRKIPYNPMELE